MYHHVLEKYEENKEQEKTCKATQRVKPKTCQRMNGGHGLALQAVLGHR